METVPVFLAGLRTIVDPGFPFVITVATVAARCDVAGWSG